jgi:hypothetical protein
MTTSLGSATPNPTSNSDSLSFSVSKIGSDSLLLD